MTKRVERNTLVMPGLEPGIHQSSLGHRSKAMDRRVNPGNDGCAFPCNVD
jgi:hypothetical protein